MRSALVALAVGGTATLSISVTAAASSNPKTVSAAQTVTVALPSDITSFDPATNQLIEYIYAIRNNVFSTLVKYGPNLAVVPDLATPAVNKQATVFTFTLHPGALFQNGAKVTATEVVQSLKRAAGKKSVYAPYLSAVRKYEVLNPTTLKLVLSKPDAALLDALTNIAIVAPSDFAKASTDPIGSGPFEFVKWVPNNEIVLKAFPKYFGKKPAYSQLVFKIIPNPSVEVNDLASGAVDVVPELPASSLAAVSSSRDRVVKASSSNSLALIEFNSKGKLGNPLIRQALAYALDKPAIRKIAYGGYGVSTWNPVPPSSWAYANLNPYSYNLSKAKALLAKAGAPNLSFTVDLPAGYPEAVQTATVWQSSLAQIGVSLKIDTEEISVWLQNYINHTYDAIWNFFNESGDPNSFYNIIMLPHLQADYHNPGMQKLIGNALATSNQATRKILYQALDKMVVNQLPVMVIQTRPLFSAVSKSVHGYQLNPLGWGIFTGIRKN